MIAGEGGEGFGCFLQVSLSEEIFAIEHCAKMQFWGSTGSAIIFLCEASSPPRAKNGS